MPCANPHNVPPVVTDPPQEHECLIDFIAVSPEARGRGVGAKLMQWAEGTGAAILAETETAAVAAHGVDMTLWVRALARPGLADCLPPAFPALKASSAASAACACQA